MYEAASYFGALLIGKVTSSQMGTNKDIELDAFNSRISLVLGPVWSTNTTVFSCCEGMVEQFVEDS